MHHNIQLVEFNFVDDERDLARDEMGLPLRGQPSVCSDSVRSLIGHQFPVRFTDRLRRLNQKTAA